MSKEVEFTEDKYAYPPTRKLPRGTRMHKEEHKMVQSLSRYTRSDLEGFYYQALNVLYKRADKTLHIIVHDLDMAQAS